MLRLLIQAAGRSTGTHNVAIGISNYGYNVHVNTLAWILHVCSCIRQYENTPVNKYHYFRHSSIFFRKIFGHFFDRTVIIVPNLSSHWKRNVMPFTQTFTILHEAFFCSRQIFSLTIAKHFVQNYYTVLQILRFLSIYCRILHTHCI